MNIPLNVRPNCPTPLTPNSWQGNDGATFTPAVSGDGVISWTNNKGLPDPSPVNIRGPQGPQGETGNGISSIVKTSSAGLVDTYTITYTDGTSATYTVTNGKDGEDGYSPTIAITDITGGHRVTITDETGAHTFDVMDGEEGATGNGISSIIKSSTSGLVDTYTITYTNGNTTTFTVTNGKNGEDGVSPTVTVTDITGGHRVTVTDETGAHTFDVMDGAVQDVQVNGVSVLQDEVANVPIGYGNTLGVVRGDINHGTYVQDNGVLRVYPASAAQIKNSSVTNCPITPFSQGASVFYGLAIAAGSDEKNSTLPVGQYTEAAKSAISEMLNGAVTVEGATPTINALPGVRYVCGEVTTLDITLPASGIVDVTFESGSTPTVLTVTPPTGVTLKWANEFDPTALEAETTYEINIMDGIGVAVGVSA